MEPTGSFSLPPRPLFDKIETLFDYFIRATAVVGPLETNQHLSTLEPIVQSLSVVFVYETVVFTMDETEFISLRVFRSEVRGYVHLFDV